MTTSSFPHLGKSQGSTTPLVQWSSLALEEPPSWSWLTSRPGKYALAQCLENYQDLVFLTPLLSPANLSAVFSMKKEIAKRFHGKRVISWPINAWNVKKGRFPNGILTIFYQKMLPARQIRHLWVASDIAISLLSWHVSQTLSFDPSSASKFFSDVLAFPS